jgi:hypothetical protein
MCARASAKPLHFRADRSHKKTPFAPGRTVTLTRIFLEKMAICAYIGTSTFGRMIGPLAFAESWAHVQNLTKHRRTGRQAAPTRGFASNCIPASKD